MFMMRHTFVVGGQFCPPAVHWLDDAAAEAFRVRQAIAGASRKARTHAMRLAFGVDGADYALPATSRECMERIALEYTGAYETELRGLCAAIATGRYGRPLSGDDSGADGGSKVDAPKPAPRKPRPGGSTFTDLMAGSAA